MQGTDSLENNRVAADAFVRRLPCHAERSSAIAKRSHCGVEASLPSPLSIHGYHSAAKSFHSGLRRSNKAIFFARAHPFSCFSRPSALWTSS